jgi:archaellum component FlaC
MNEIISSLEQDVNVQSANIAELTESIGGKDEKIGALEAQVHNAEAQLEEVSSELYSGKYCK